MVTSAMVPDDAVTIMQQDPIQLVQAKVPLDSAADTFATRDAWGRIPIAIVPTRLNHIRHDHLIVAFGVAILAVLAQTALSTWWIVPLIIPFALALSIYALWGAFYVSIPEGASGLLTWGGKYLRTINSGMHMVPPWVVVSHLVTLREIPFDVPVVEAQTKDNVRVTVTSLCTFAINGPYRFVYAIPADDFSQVLHASCQEELRALIRQVRAEEVIDLVRAERENLADAISADVAQYGIEIMKLKVTYVQLPEEFLRLQEQRQLALWQREEQADSHALAQKQQEHAHQLARQELNAQLERERDAVKLQIQQAEALKQVSQLEAEAEAMRMAKLEERLRSFPRAAKYDQDLERERLKASLAQPGPVSNVSNVSTGNSHLKIPGGYVGPDPDSEDTAHSFAVHNTLQHPAMRSYTARHVSG
jgi:regulator of protease activity HflC (stomatin/prohibitin superfamily)